MEMTVYREKIECPLSCEVPEGVTLTLVPVPRHAWADVLICPNGDEVECGRAFLVTKVKQ